MSGLSAKKRPPPIGDPRVAQPTTVLLEEVHRTAGHIEKLSEIVDAIPREDLVVGVTRRVLDAEGGETIMTETALNIWLRLYQGERKHLLNVCKAAAACGVELKPSQKEASRVDDLSARRAARLAGGSGT